jgi:[methyl-Co(III) methanol-specific corrinoid protein]:coenzyme M methyltransferase
MNSRERFLTALKGGRPDRSPLAHVAAMTTVELQQATGCFMPAVHLDAGQQARLMAANHDVLGFDAVSFLINFFNEPAALGVEMDWGAPDRLPTFTSHPWRMPDDAVIPGDFLDRAPIKVCLDTLRIARRDCGDRMAVLGKIMGPFSMLQAMHGVENVLMGVLDDPARIVAFLDICADVLVRHANAQFEAGADAISIGEGGAGARMISPQDYETCLLPVHQRLIARIQGPVILHICGDVRSRIHLLAQTGMTCFNFDWAVPPAEMTASAAGRYTVMGNINTTDLLCAGPAELARQVDENLAAGVHIISPGCATSPRCPNSNLRALADAIASHKLKN